MYYTKHTHTHIILIINNHRHQFNSTFCRVPTPARKITLIYHYFTLIIHKMLIRFPKAAWPRAFVPSV